MPFGYHIFFIKIVSDLCMFLGILLGLCAATLQSTSYLASRIFLSRNPNASIPLMAISHTVMGMISAVMLCFIWPDKAPPWNRIVIPLIGMSAFYIIAQIALFWALKYTAASRASPLLSLKVFILALLSLFFWSTTLSLQQWVAVFLSVLAAFILNGSGGSIPGKAISGIMVACFGYALSDISIRTLVVEFSELGLFYGSVITVCLNYSLCGTVSLLAFRFLPIPNLSVTRKRMWADALPFTVTWFFAMFFLFACFGSIGVIFGNIVQSTRGIISILMGWLISHLGHIHLEEKVERSVFIPRIFAGIMMFGAIVLFYLG